MFCSGGIQGNSINLKVKYQREQFLYQRYRVRLQDIVNRLRSLIVVMQGKRKIILSDRRL
jgi:hypothetical protein